jgi:hypothetical protein
MSNNRKRNMKRLARNIITGAALAVGGLSNVPEMSAAEQNGSGVSALQIAGVVLPALGSAAGIAMAAKSASDSQKLTATGNTETARHNKWVEDVKNKETETIEKLPMAQADFDTMIGHLTAQKAKMGGNSTVMKNKVRDIVGAGKPGVRPVITEIQNNRWGGAVKSWMESITSDPEGAKLNQLVDAYIDYVKGNQGNLVKGCVVLCTQRQPGGRGDVADVLAAMDGQEQVIAGDNAEIYQIQAGSEKPGKELRDVWNSILGENMKLLLGDSVAPHLMVPWRWGPHAAGGNGDFGLKVNNVNNHANWNNTVVSGAGKAIANWGKAEDNAGGGHAKNRKDFIDNTPAGIYLMTNVETTTCAANKITSLNTAGAPTSNGYKLVFQEGHASMGKTKPAKVKEMRDKLNRLIWDTAGATEVRPEVDKDFDANY